MPRTSSIIFPKCQEISKINIKKSTLPFIYGTRLKSIPIIQAAFAVSNWSNQICPQAIREGADANTGRTSAPHMNAMTPSLDLWVILDELPHHFTLEKANFNLSVSNPSKDRLSKRAKIEDPRS